MTDLHEQEHDLHLKRDSVVVAALQIVTEERSVELRPPAAHDDASAEYLDDLLKEAVVQYADALRTPWEPIAERPPLHERHPEWFEKTLVCLYPTCKRTDLVNDWCCPDHATPPEVAT